jgi:VWFA-related protein
VTGRLIAIVVDRGSIQPVRAKDVFAATARFVDRLDPADQVALISIPSGPRVDFTPDHALVKSALLKTDGQANPRVGVKGIGLADALKMANGNSLVTEEVISRECGNIGQSELMICRKLVREEAMLMADEIRQRTRSTVGALRSILERLGTTDTPKTLVLVSEGLVIDGERTDLSWVAKAAAAAQVSIYALQPDPTESDASQSRPPAGLSLDRTLRKEGLDSLAQQARGEVFSVVASPDVAVNRLEMEISGYYLLAFEPEASDRDGKRHLIKVDAARDHVAVRARPEFTVAVDAARTADQEIAATLRSPILSTAIPLKLTTYTFQEPGTTKLRVLLGTEIDRSAMANTPVALGYMLVDGKGRVVTSRFEPALAPPAGSSKIQQVFGTVIVDPGSYSLKVAVVDSEGRRGSVERKVDAGVTRLGQIRVADLLLADGGAEARGATLSPTISAEFSGDMLNTYLELFSDAPEVLRNARVTIEIAGGPTANAVESAQAMFQASGGDEKSRAAGATVPIALLPPGEYVARAVISVSGRPAGQITRAFRIVPRTTQ